MGSSDDSDSKSYGNTGPLVIRGYYDPLGVFVDGAARVGNAIWYMHLSDIGTSFWRMFMLLALYGVYEIMFSQKESCLLSGLLNGMKSSVFNGANTPPIATTFGLNLACSGWKNFACDRPYDLTPYQTVNAAGVRQRDLEGLSQTTCSSFVGL